MSDIEYLLECAKQCREAKDAMEILDIVQDIEELDALYRQGDSGAVVQLVQVVIKKHQAEVAEHDKGQPPAQDIHQLYRSCRSFLIGLSRDEVEKKIRGKFAEEALKYLRGN